MQERRTTDADAPQPEATAQHTPKRTPVKAAAAALVGTSIEWYDFFIYATAAALVFRELFFSPELSPLTGTIIAFATTSFGYLGRPIGALIFGSLGDRIGRKRTLVFTLLLMGAATFGMGLLPTYEQVGAFAPLGLITLRLLQGVAVGGEWGGAALLSVEHAPEGRKTFFGSFTQMGSSVGALLSSLVFLVAENLSGGLLAGWWRLPFLFSAVLVVIALIVRLTVEESPEFVAAQLKKYQTTSPLREIAGTLRGRVLLGAGTMLVATGGYYVTSSFFLAYATEQAGVSAMVMLNALTFAAVCEVLFMPLAGWLGDRWRPQYVVAVGLGIIAVIGLPLFLITHTGNATLIFLFAAIVALGTAFNYGPMAHILTRMFPVQVRYTGISLSYQVAALTAGALTPIVVPLLLAAGDGSPVLVVAYLVVLCLTATACVLRTRRFTARDGVTERIRVALESSAS
ncbi:MFS transporter [Leucobacter sp. M11]|uniref:MFS transporter n=1 Tax=Leucobacter sp. M11 TaxID=2993565 RepID=UPI002D7E34D7|nr:MFS transporter [Leucobacter sp. M11]MEB4613358.1 MFS transporter [Leucobacter sp. M11]